MTKKDESLHKLDGVEVLNDGRWLRIKQEDEATLVAIYEKTGADLRRSPSASYAGKGDFSYLPLTFVDGGSGRYDEVRVVFAINQDRIISLEPSSTPAVITTAIERMKRDSRDNDGPFDIIADILQSIADATDSLIGQLSDEIERMMVETSATLSSLEVKSRDFGVSDVASIQLDLSGMEELLSHCMESQLSLVRAARHLRARALAVGLAVRETFNKLIDDIQAIEHYVDFVHDRVRFLQQVNNMALNVKQNQIVKVFSVITAVFLPSMLVTTYYSMNIEYMPILQWQHGELTVMVLTFLFALMPLFYIKYRGWLR